MMLEDKGYEWCDIVLLKSKQINVDHISSYQQANKYKLESMEGQHGLNLKWLTKHKQTSEASRMYRKCNGEEKNINLSAYQSHIDHGILILETL